MIVSLDRHLPPRLPTDKTVSDSTLLHYWRRGLDTYAIALQLNIPEHEVANRLPRIRERERQNNQWEGR
jgi:DNA-binding CsgD family transcriptional regulator